MRPGRLSPAERLRALLEPAPVHERLPALRPVPRRWTKALSAAVMRPAALLGRLVVRPASRVPAFDAGRLRSIAFVRIDHLGDVIMATPVLSALRAWAPGARITVWGRGATEDLLRRLPSVDEVEVADVPWIRPGPGSGENLQACLDLARTIRARRFDLAIDLRYHNRLDSLLLSLCGARARLGFDAGGFGFGITHCARWPREGHEVEKMAGALRQFGIPVNDLATAFPLLPDELAAAARLTKRARRFVAIHVGAGNAIKRWMPDRFAWVGCELARRARVRIAVLAGPGEEALGEPLVRALPNAACLDLRGKLGLFDLGAVIKRAALFVGNDGGAGHISSAVGTPSVIVFSGTNEAASWAPLGKCVRVLEHRVPCKPCASTTCPFDQACLREVSVDEVLRDALEMLGRKAPKY